MTNQPTDLLAKLDAPRREMPSPTEADLADPIFEAVWQTTKTWDVNAPEYYVGYCGMNGSHVKLILDALAPLRAELLAARALIEVSRECSGQEAEYETLYAAYRATVEGK